MKYETVWQDIGLGIYHYVAIVDDGSIGGVYLCWNFINEGGIGQMFSCGKQD
tara:strand:+ start:1652 stop:1807 length:156 start_codon:yes stop_codon:yes gene_type:complete